jgi:hypothetical protein
MRPRKVQTLTMADIGKRITFTSEGGRSVEGVIRAFTHGVFSNASKGETDVPLVGINIYAARSHEHHWARPETLAVIQNLSKEGDA